MILVERQKQLNSVFKDLEGINRRQAYISTKYILASERYSRTFMNTDREERENLNDQLESLSDQFDTLSTKLRSMQTQYLVEYDSEYLEGISEITSIFRHREELYFLTDCMIDTFQDGWNMEDENTQELLYEIADFILTHKFSKFFIRNIKRL